MTSLQKLYSVTLTYFLKVIKFRMLISRQRLELAQVPGILTTFLFSKMQTIVKLFLQICASACTGTRCRVALVVKCVWTSWRSSDSKGLKNIETISHLIRTVDNRRRRSSPHTFAEAAARKRRSSWHRHRQFASRRRRLRWRQTEDGGTGGATRTSDWAGRDCGAGGPGGCGRAGGPKAHRSRLRLAVGELANAK